MGESEGGAGEGGTGGGAGKMLLWVDQYSPKNFTELLSDDVSRVMSNSTYRIPMDLEFPSHIGGNCA